MNENPIIYIHPLLHTAGELIRLKTTIYGLGGRFRIDNLLPDPNTWLVTGFGDSNADIQALYDLADVEC